VIKLGYVKEDGYFKETFYLNTNFLTRHICIFGTTGSGKSTTLSIIAYELNKLGIPVIIFDRTGEYTSRLKKWSYTIIPGYNYYASPFGIWHDLEIEERVQNEIWLLNEYCRITWNEQLSPLQIRLLTESLLNIYRRGHNPNFDNIVKECRKIIEHELKIWYESAEAIASRFQIFTVGKFKKAFLDISNSKPKLISNLRGINILDLSVFENDEPKNMLSLIAATSIYLEIKRAGFSKKIRLVLAIDEAQNLINKNEKYSILEKMSMELRKYGLSLILVSPRPSNLSENILSNCGTFISHQILSSYDIDMIKKHAYSTNFKYSLENVLYSLNCGEAFIRTLDELEGRIIKIGTEEHESIIH
jgi:type IV secretory pathway VirB4 component